MDLHLAGIISGIHSPYFEGTSLNATVNSANPNILHKHLTVKTHFQAFEGLHFQAFEGLLYQIFLLCFRSDAPSVVLLSTSYFLEWCSDHKKTISGNKSTYTCRLYVNICRYKVTKSIVFTPNRKQTRLLVSIESITIWFLATLGYKAPHQLARCWKVSLITARAEATPIETRSILFYPRHTRLVTRRKLRQLQGSFNTLRKQQRNTSKMSLTPRREPVSYEYQRAIGIMWACMGV